MSSTNRGAVRSPNDYYRTDPKEIARFLRRWVETDEDARDFWAAPRNILDPCAGGLTETVTIEQKAPKPPMVFEPSEMSYPVAIKQVFPTARPVDTLDIRENSLAIMKDDFLKVEYLPASYDIVISNPPFSLAIQFIRRALEVVKPGGYVVMLLRLNFFGSEERNAFFLLGNMPEVAYVHAKRLGFTPDGKTDSIEYMHAIWRKSPVSCFETKLRVLPY